MNPGPLLERTFAFVGIHCALMGTGTVVGS